MRIIAGTILIILGIVIRKWAINTLAADFQLIIQIPSKVVRAGPYKYMRHPSYIGSIMIIGGAALFSPALGIVLTAWAFFKSRMVVEDEIIRRLEDGHYKHSV